MDTGGRLGRDGGAPGCPPLRARSVGSPPFTRRVRRTTNTDHTHHLQGEESGLAWIEGEPERVAAAEKRAADACANAPDKVSERAAVVAVVVGWWRWWIVAVVLELVARGVVAVRVLRARVEILYTRPARLSLSLARSLPQQLGDTMPCLNAPPPTPPPLSPLHGRR